MIYPSAYAFKEKGVAMSESGTMTFALKKGAGGWKITAWTWTSPDPAPVK